MHPCMFEGCAVGFDMPTQAEESGVEYHVRSVSRDQQTDRQTSHSLPEELQPSCLIFSTLFFYVFTPSNACRYHVSRSGSGSGSASSSSSSSQSSFTLPSPLPYPYSIHPQSSAFSLHAAATPHHTKA